MFGQLCVVHPLDGLGAGEGDAANAGDATTTAATAAHATINAITAFRIGLGRGLCGAASAPPSRAGPPCSPCSFTSLAPPQGIEANSVAGKTQSDL
jgi:hypothetical protein